MCRRAVVNHIRNTVIVNQMIRSNSHRSTTNQTSIVVRYLHQWNDAQSKTVSTICVLCAYVFNLLFHSFVVLVLNYRVHFHCHMCIFSHFYRMTNSSYLNKCAFFSFVRICSTMFQVNVARDSYFEITNNEL